ncbi:MAG: hypothetical protein MJZ82_03985 [Paludibacteraceae bacterium]|nr:hypothetical protein [Paludibacteraceae bacterium]
MSWLDYIILVPLLVALIWSIFRGAHHLLSGVLNLVKWALILMVLVFVTGQLDNHFHFIPEEIASGSPVYQTLSSWSNLIADWILGLVHRWID